MCLNYLLDLYGNMMDEIQGYGSSCSELDTSNAMLVQQNTTYDVTSAGVSESA